MCIEEMCFAEEVCLFDFFKIVIFLILLLTRRDTHTCTGIIGIVSGPLRAGGFDDCVRCLGHLSVIIILSLYYYTHKANPEGVCYLFLFLI